MSKDVDAKCLGLQLIPSIPPGYVFNSLVKGTLLHGILKDKNLVELVIRP